MTLYEELGVPQDAMPDTIREAYRNVARVLHPDAQTNPVLKQSAEVQMKRINHLYEILSDPERRRRYDQSLAEPPDRPDPIIIQAPPRPDEFRRNHSGTVAWLAATAICGTFIIWLATRESSAPAVYPQPVSSDAVPLPSPLHRVAAAILPRSSSERSRDDEIARLRAELAAANADRERLTKQIAAQTAAQTAAMDVEHRLHPPPSDPSRQPVPPPSPQNLATLTPTPLAAQPAPVEIPGPVVTPAVPPPNEAPRPRPSGGREERWAGSWIYLPHTERPGSTLFPPEFIETIITEDNGRISGQYHARFKVAGAKISPNVDFTFEGTVAGKSGSFPWTGADGAKGDVKLRLVSETTLEVVWAATSLGKTMGLASGAALLNRK